MAGEAKEIAATVAGVSLVIKFEILAGSELAWEQIPSMVCFHMVFTNHFLTVHQPSACSLTSSHKSGIILEKERLNSPTYFVLDTQHKCQI